MKKNVSSLTLVWTDFGQFRDDPTTQPTEATSRIGPKSPECENFELLSNQQLPFKSDLRLLNSTYDYLNRIEKIYWNFLIRWIKKQNQKYAYESFWKMVNLHTVTLIMVDQQSKIKCNKKITQNIIIIIICTSNVRWKVTNDSIYVLRGTYYLEIGLCPSIVVK